MGAICPNPFVLDIFTGNVLQSLVEAFRQEMKDMRRDIVAEIKKDVQAALGLKRRSSSE